MEQTDKLQLPSEELIKDSQQKKQDQQSKWKSKSLNSLPTEHYEMDITKSFEPKKIQTKQTKKSSKQPQNQGKKSQTSQKILPAPKIKKINEKTFCITIDNQINVFYLLDTNEKIKMKTKKSFGMLKHQIGNNIEFVAGNNSNFIFLGSLTELIILDLYKKQDKYFIKEVSRKQIPNLRAVTFVASQLIAVSSDQVFQYNLSNFDLVAKKAIQFQKEDDKKLFNTLKSVGLVVESMFCFYYFGTITQQKIDYNAKKKYAVQGGPPPSKQCEVLHIVKFKIQQNLQISYFPEENSQLRKNKMMTVTQLAESRIISIKIQIFPIDHVFQTGIFQKSKIFQIEESVFLMSLHQEIILIKKHFNKFIVWDNVSIVSSKSQQKKGQLVLADKRILVYSQNGQIFAHDIFFNEEESRINMPPIDGFRGNDNDQEILYDAVLLQYDKESLMKVLFYFKQIDVILPNKSKFRKQTENPAEVHDQNALHFTMLCINQSDPKQKLKQLLRLKKQPNEIAEFCERFGINSLQKTKCMWSVSDKSLKDIQNVLLQISDDKYIQTELDNILKKQPHNLTFLISVQKKQIARLKKLLVRNLLNQSQTTSQTTITYAQDSPDSAKKKVQYAKKVIQWLMESIMFQKKLDYSKNFLSFKEYDFIQIGKLKAASLKQQIKLLSCKKYEKRLKYFLNSFKILAIANWQQIFRFLLINKNQKEIQEFLIQFGFILPQFYQTSNVFQQKQQFDVGINKKAKDLKKQKNNDEKCILWDDLQQIQTLIGQAIMNAGQQKSKVTNQSGEKPLNTIQDFLEMVVENIRSFKKDKRQQNEAIQNFKSILKQIVESNWFSVAAFKQHSMLNKTSKQLKQEFYELKNRGAYKILIKYLYQQIQNSNPSITFSGINQMLIQFVSLGIIPQSFKKNDDARLQVYKLLEKKSIQNLSKQYSIPKKSEYLIWNEDQYFSFLFKHIKEDILKTVKSKYEDIESGFFRQRFQLYLKSTLVNLKGIINFLAQFQQSSSDDVRVDIFNCIKRLLKLGDYQNTRDFIQKSLQKQVLPQKSGEMSGSIDANLRQQAKIPYGFVFYHFFKVFNLDYTYEQLIQSTQNTNLQTNNLLKELIHKYCAGQIYKDTDYDKKQQCRIIFEDNKIISQKIAEVDILHEPLQFFGVILYMVSILEFQVVQEDLFKFMLQEYLNQGKVEKIEQFITSIVEYTVNAQSLNTKNYQLITDFKDSHPTQDIFIDYSLDWISKKYSQIKQNSSIEITLKSINSVLVALNKFQGQKIKDQQHLFSLLLFIKKFNPQLMTKVDFIKQELKHSGFIFLMHIFRQIGVDCFINCNCEDQQNQQMGNHSSNNAKHTASSINTKIYYFNLIFDKYKEINKSTKIDNQKQSGIQFVRFLVQLCCILIGQKKYEMAWQLLLRSMTAGYYFNDAFYYFVSVSKIQKVKQFKEAFRNYVSIETINILIAKLKEMFKFQQNNSSSRILSIPQEKSSIFDIKGKQQTVNSPNNYLFLFEQLLQNNRIDEAFFFLIRIRSANMQLVAQKTKNNRKFGNSGRSPAYILLVVYFKCLQKYISEEFYPTFLFFKSKFQILIDNLNRKDIIKDINIAISRLKQKFQQQDDKNQVIKKDIQQSYKLLKNYYQLYMQSIQEDPIIKLTEEDQELATKRIQMYAKITQQDDREGLFEQQTREQKQAKLRLQQNQLKMNQIHQKNKLNVVRKEVNQSISQARRNADKYAHMLEQKKKQQNKITYAEKKEKQIQDIKRKEMQDVASIKDSYKSTTTQKVNDLIQNLRKKREVISQHRTKNIALRQEVTQNVKQIPSKDIIPEPYKPTQNLPNSKYQGPVRPQNDTLMPLANRQGMKASDIIQNFKKSVVIDQGPKHYQKKQQNYKLNSKNKVSREEISELLKQHEPEAFKYLEKFDLVKQNMQIAVELIKRMFSAIHNLQNFVQFVKYLLDLDPKYKQILQEKSLPIVAQMIKMGQKINLKQLVSSQLFTNVQRVSLKDYYDIAYTTLRPNIMKILEKQEVTIHTLGILLRFSLGSETKYFNRTVIDYIKVLLKGYSGKLYDDKETTLLAQKLRNQYLSMQEQNRENNFQQLLNQIPNQNSKKKLLEALNRVNQKKSESVLGGKQTEQFSRIIKRLSK